MSVAPESIQTSRQRASKQPHLVNSVEMMFNNLQLVLVVRVNPSVHAENSFAVPLTSNSDQRRPALDRDFQPVPHYNC